MLLPSSAVRSCRARSIFFGASSQVDSIRRGDERHHGPEEAEESRRLRQPPGEGHFAYLQLTAGLNIAKVPLGLGRSVQMWIA